MLREAIDAEAQVCRGPYFPVRCGLSVRDMREYLGYVADSRLERLEWSAFHCKNPFSFMELQDVQELTTSLNVASLRIRRRFHEVGFSHEDLLRQLERKQATDCADRQRILLCWSVCSCSFS